MLNVSIVLYKHGWSDVASLIETLFQSTVVDNIYIIDNSPTPSEGFQKKGIQYIFTGKNIGYGSAHNIALRKTINNDIPYHLVVNPDIQFDAKILDELIHFMEAHPVIGHLMPKVVYPDGNIQYLCKLLPKPSDLFFRRFLPEKWMSRSKHRFEMRETGYTKLMDVPYLSGCFMFLRTDALKQVGLFDERFFLYPEDIDLTRRIHKVYKTVFYPHVSITHHHERTSYVSWRMMVIHAWNLIKYFNKWGWIFDQERNLINKQHTKIK